MDGDHDNQLSRQEAIDLLTMLGYSKADRKLQVFLHIYNLCYGPVTLAL